MQTLIMESIIISLMMMKKFKMIINIEVFPAHQQIP